MGTMADTAALLAAYDAQMRMPPGPIPTGITHEHDGPLLRIVGGHMGRIRAPRDLGVTGAALDRLIARQRDYFHARGEAVEWKLRAHDLPADLPERLTAAGFLPGTPSTVLLGEARERRIETEGRIRDSLGVAPHEAMRLTGLAPGEALPELRTVERVQAHHRVDHVAWVVRGRDLLGDRPERFAGADRHGLEGARGRIALARRERGAACEDARAGLRMLESGMRLNTIDANGQRAVIDDAERARRAETMRRMLSANCAAGPG